MIYNDIVMLIDYERSVTMIIKELLTETYNQLCVSFKGNDWCVLCLPAKGDGFVDVELSSICEISVVNNEPMISIKFKRKTVKIPRCHFGKIEIF